VKRRLHVSDRAKWGIVRISTNVEEKFGAAVEERVLARIRTALDMLAQQPDVGHRRSDLGEREGLRFWTVGPSLIAYRFDRHKVEIVAVGRADQDWTRMLDVSRE